MSTGDQMAYMQAGLHRTMQTLCRWRGPEFVPQSVLSSLYVIFTCSKFWR
jgi:hypothetical protein